MNLIRESWQGARSLQMVFWGYYVAFQVVYIYVLFALVGAAPEPLDMMIAVPGMLFLLPYSIWIYVSIWRCAKNSAPIWRILARAWIVVVLIAAAGRIAEIAIPTYQKYQERAEQSEQNE